MLVGYLLSCSMGTGDGAQETGRQPSLTPLQGELSAAGARDPDRDDAVQSNSKAIANTEPLLAQVIERLND